MQIFFLKGTGVVGVSHETARKAKEEVRGGMEGAKID